MFEVIVISVIILSVVMFLLSIKIIFRKNGRFPNTHIGDNAALREKKIKCAKTQDIEARDQMDIFERIKKEM